MTNPANNVSQALVIAHGRFAAANPAWAAVRERYEREVPVATREAMRDQHLPVPAGWTVLDEGIDGYAARRHDLRVIASAELHGDDWWLHVSVSRSDGRMPRYQDLCTVREAWIGDRWAYQVFAPRAQHVNLHATCLHLWAPIDGEPRLPDFTRGSGSI